MRQVTVDDAQYVALVLATALFSYDEPMPEFATRFPGKLESCLYQPFVEFDGKALHYHLTKKSAVLFYMIIKNHPFLNGNKRMAVTITLVFLYSTSAG